MSRSRKKNVYYKDPGMSTHSYWSTIRHEWKQQLHVNKENEDVTFRNPEEIINDYDYCDYIVTPNQWDKKEKIKYSRK